MKPSASAPVLPLTVERYGSGGEGVAHLPDGMTCFVQGALRGERCLVRLDKVGRSCAWGTATEILSPSPARQVVDCPYFSACGGCSLRHMDYGEELSFKRQKVQDALTRIGGSDVVVETILGAADTTRYRNKVQFPVAPGPAIGFYRARTHRVVDVEDCLLQSTDAAALRRAVKDWMVRYRVSSYDERAHKGLVRHVYVRTNAAGESLCCLVVNGTSLPHEDALVDALRQAVPTLVGVVLGVNQAKTNVILGERYRILWGTDTLEERLQGLTFRLSVPSFFQVNLAQTEVLYDQAVELAALTGSETVLDLYCGIGTISLTMARRAGRVIGAEVVPQAIEDAKANAARNGVTNAEFFCGDAGAVAGKLAQDGLRPQVICVDPPRKGLGPEVPAILAGMGPARIVYVSCDPATLARDLARFVPLGYSARTARAVDLFPRTPHVETVVLLCRQ